MTPGIAGMWDCVPRVLLLTFPYLVGGVLVYGLARGLRVGPPLTDVRLTLLDPEALDREGVDPAREEAAERVLRRAGDRLPFHVE
jgi:hypothetical protein